MWDGGSGPKIVDAAQPSARRLAQQRQCKIIRQSNAVGCPCGARWQCPCAYTAVAAVSTFVPEDASEEP